jgi:glycosyltransferase involved in cell wall biosynthesis
LLWVEKEVLPWVPSLFELALLPPRVPVVVDYDDAVFHSYDLHRNTLVRRLLAHKIDHFMARAALVVAGNPYLAARASAAGARRIELLPTVIDLSRYGAQPVAPHPLTIGWIGSPSTVPYLREIASVLVEAVSPVGGRVIAVGAHPAQLADLPIEVQPWSEDSEVEAIRQFDIGVMPLPDDPWSRGKCGYKLIQYMGCGLPVIASPVGINGEIVDDGRNGLLAQGHDAWRCALARLVADPALRQSMGTAALQKVTDKYQLAVTAPRLTQLLRSTLGGLSPLDHVRNADHD